VTPVKTLLPSDVALRSSTGGMRKVLLVDDHPVVRAGLRQLLSQENDLDVCGEAGTAVEALTRCAGHPPDIVLIDMLLDESGNSLELIRELRARHPALRIVVLSMYAEEIYATAARQAGADAYVMKQAKPEVLLEALRS
jgi:DNA-binding NarL/FixJ family response regulator